jgi:hypothetical protein
VDAFVAPSKLTHHLNTGRTKHANFIPGTYSRLQLVFVHAENDTTMPWVETESLFKSTLQAAIESTSPDEGIPKDLRVVDLGEAGRLEVWQSGSRCIQKTIAKHGGKRVRSQLPGLASRSLGDHPEPASVPTDDWLPFHSLDTRNS